MYYRLYDDKPELETAPERQKDGRHVFEMVKNIKVVYGKRNFDGPINRSIPPIEGVPFKKQSIFYKYLPYWPDLEVSMP